MSHKITVTPSDAVFESDGSETLLAAAVRQGLNLPHSCQSGVCGTCKAKLVSGSVSADGAYDDYVLNEEEKQAGMVLLCCCRADSDLEVEMPSYAGSKALTVRTLPARVGSVEIRGDVAVMTVALPKAPPFVFYPGQYMEILLKDGSRSYSIANAPSQNGTLEFHIKHHPGGLFSPQLFTGSLKKGAIIRLRGPFGSFTLNDSGKPMILLATGTGFAPVKSIVSHIAETAPERRLHIFHGTRHREGLYDETALTQLLERLPNARYTPVLSRPDALWQGERGYIGDIAAAAYPDLSGCEVYACGSPDMIASARTICLNNGLPESAFFSDAFSPHV